MTYYLYKITNKINGKIYFGKAANIKKRWNGHKTSARLQIPGDYFYIHRSMNKYGFENFTIEEVCSFATETEALAAEIEYIAKYNTIDDRFGYNLTEGGDGASGYKHTDETKQKMSENRKGKCEGENNSFYGKRHTKEYKEQHSKTMMDLYDDNKEMYDELNKQQCLLTTEQCIEIQKQYLQGNISFEKLAKKYSVEITTIWKIVHSDYAAIKGSSIITEDMFQEIKQKRKQQQTHNSKVFSDEKEKEIIDYYLHNDIRLKDLAATYNVSTPTIRKFFKLNNITIKRNFARGARKSSTLTAEMVREIREKFATGQYTYKQLSKEYPVSVGGIPHIIKKRTWKNI